MDRDLFPPSGGRLPDWRPASLATDPEPQPEVARLRPIRPGPRRYRIPLLLFLLTCATTTLIGPLYAASIMLILTTHEMGHYLQARRHGVPVSLPYFLPMPIGLIGTLGAVIRMNPSIADRKALFDIAITGPLAGLVPTFVLSAIGIHRSQVVDAADASSGIELGVPLVFDWLSRWIVGPLGEEQTLLLDPLAYAGWVGLLITALNLIPIGQLDGGHIFYALLRKTANRIAVPLLGIAIISVVVGRLWVWSVMLVLLVIMGPRHPPTANDDVPLGRGRQILGWLTLLFIVVGFTPNPLRLDFGPS